ncbi:MAG TPA: c-type cytochrome [Gemmatimonadales bacterium]
MRMLSLVLGVVLTGVWDAAAAQAPDGPGLYRQHCRACHGARGVPTREMRSMFKGIAVLSDSAFLAARSSDSIVAVLQKGLRAMPPFKERMTKPEMVAVAEHVRTLAGGAR